LRRTTSSTPGDRVAGSRSANAINSRDSHCRIAAPRRDASFAGHQVDAILAPANAVAQADCRQTSDADFDRAVNMHHGHARRARNNGFGRAAK
jgi:hypothetical protein